MNQFETVNLFIRNLRSEAAFREHTSGYISTSNTADWTITFFFVFYSFFLTHQREFVFISLQMGGNRDIDRLTNCEEFFQNVRRNVIITESTKISRWMRAGYNWMSRKMAALPAIFYRNRFRRFDAKVPGKER